jgi:hypothetical protein
MQFMRGASVPATESCVWEEVRASFVAPLHAIYCS